MVKNVKHESEVSYANVWEGAISLCLTLLLYKIYVEYVLSE